ncbi:hypothetical protein [Pseudoneobacillus sp. C159]
MKQKLLSYLGGTVLSISLLSGCAMNNDNDNDNQNPPPEDVRTNMNGNDVRNDVDDQLTNDHYPESEDINTPSDKDPSKDRNTPQEDIVEDDIDARDRDNKDE